MSYIYSQLTHKYYSLDNDIYTEIPIDDSNSTYNAMILSGNITEVESIPFEISAINTQKAIVIDLYYTKEIADLMEKHNDKVIEAVYFNSTYTIPQFVLDRKQALKDECNAKIAELGITDYTYRQSVPKLAKVEI